VPEKEKGSPIFKADGDAAKVSEVHRSKVQITVWFGLWKTQIELILEKHGLLSFVVHPEYLVSEEAKAIYGNC
jgi:hypothetical protein